MASLRNKSFNSQQSGIINPHNKLICSAAGDISLTTETMSPQNLLQSWILIRANLVNKHLYMYQQDVPQNTRILKYETYLYLPTNHLEKSQRNLFRFLKSVKSYLERRKRVKI